MPIVPASITAGHIHIDHEADIIDNLIHHVRDSLVGTAPDLPEIKKLQIKLSKAYIGKDNFDKLDNWLQGLLHYFKLNQLMSDDRDADCVLVTGHSLKGKAE
jgi:hypothetical protein